MPYKQKLCFILLIGFFVSSCGGGGGKDNSSDGPGTGSQDTTPPIVQSTNPSDSAIEVPMNCSVHATFSENITATNPSNVFMLTQAGTNITGAVSFSGNTATFKPSTKLDAHTSYTATLTTGVKDSAGNPLSSPYAWSFTTSDCSAITLNKQFTLSSVPSSAMFKALATDGTSIYLWTQADFLATNGAIYKIDPANGQILATTNIPLVAMSPSSPVNGIQFIADIAWHNGALWATGTYIASDGSYPQGIFRVNQATGRSESQIPVAGGLVGEVTILQGLASDETHFFVAIDRNYASPTPAEHVIVRFDPTANTQIPLSPALLNTTGQATRLDYGSNSLWVFNNPDFQQVDPLSGAILSNYCKTDGGANILFFDDNIWSIKDNILMAYSLN